MADRRAMEGAGRALLLTQLRSGSDAELAAVPLFPHEWHGDWNYAISARSVVA